MLLVWWARITTTQRFKEKRGLCLYVCVSVCCCLLFGSGLCYRILMPKLWYVHTMCTIVLLLTIYNTRFVCSITRYYIFYYHHCNTTTIISLLYTQQTLHREASNNTIIITRTVRYTSDHINGWSMFCGMVRKNM